MGISNLLASKPPQPRIVAKDRLKFALIYDRTGCSPQILENIKIDIIKVISNYLYVDEKMIDIQISQVDTEDSTNAPVLFANIPIRGTRKVPRRT